jgi:hypothetical protein
MALTQQEIEETRKKLNIKPQTTSTGTNQLSGAAYVAQLRNNLQTQDELGQSGFNGFTVGAAKGLTSTFTGASSLGEKMMGSLLKTILPKSLEEKTGISQAPSLNILKKPEQEVQTSAEKMIPKEYRTPVGGAEKAGFITEQIAEFLVPSSKIAKAEKGLNLLQRAATEGLTFGVQTAMQQGDINKDVKDAVILGTLFPVGGAALKETGKFAKKFIGGVTEPLRENMASRVVNSLVKPLLKDFSYGKNPGLGIAKAGIVGKSLDELAQNITIARSKIGQQIGNLLDSIPSQVKLNLEPALKYVEDAMNSAVKQNNTTLLNRLNEVKTAITSNLERESTELGEKIVSTGKKNLSSLTAKEAAKIKTEIGDLTKWTGNLSDDQLINKALKQVYGNVRYNIQQAVNKVNPQMGRQLETLSEDYANLTSAEIATKYRDKLMQRQDLISLKGHLFGIGGALVTAISTGGAAIPAILMGVSGSVLDKILSSPQVKTKFARWLMMSSKEEVNTIFNKIPTLKASFERIFGGNIDDLKNMKAGLSIEDVSKKISQNIDQKDVKLMTEFIDNVRLAKGKSKDLDIEIMGRKLAEDMGLNPDVTAAKLADIFDKILQQPESKIFQNMAPGFEVRKIRDFKTPAVGKTADNLLEEAKKYKSAEEFVKAQGDILYHGTPAKFETKDFKGGYLTADKNYADIYKSRSASSISYGSEGVKNKASGIPRTLEFVIKKDANLFDYTNPKHRALLKDYFGKSSMSSEPAIGRSGQLDWTEGENLREFFDEKGIKFDGIKLDEAGGIDPISGLEVRRSSSVLITNPKILKTKSQLTDIWNKAHKK